MGFDDLSDADLLTVVATSCSVHRAAEEHARICLLSDTGKLTLSQQGPAGLCHFYNFNQLGVCMRKLVPTCGQMQHGHIAMAKRGLPWNVQTMKCSYFSYLLDSQMPYCKREPVRMKCICSYFCNRDDFTHLPDCEVAADSEGFRL